MASTEVDFEATKGSIIVRMAVILEADYLVAVVSLRKVTQSLRSWEIPLNIDYVRRYIDLELSRIYA